MFLQGARAAIAGALVMFLAAWVMTTATSVEEGRLTPDQTVGGVVILLIVVMLLVGVDWRRRGSK